MATSRGRGPDSSSRREAGACQSARLRTFIAGANPALHHQGRLQPGRRTAFVVYSGRRAWRLASAPGPCLAERDSRRPPGSARRSDFSQLDHGRHLRPSIRDERRRARDDSEVLREQQKAEKSDWHGRSSRNRLIDLQNMLGKAKCPSSELTWRPFMKTAVIIPARYASSRLPGKPLLRQTGKYLIQHVYERACQARNVHEVIVATDDSRIMAAAESFGGRAVMTSSDHASGTDRGADVAHDLDADVVVNLQGDEPLIEGSALGLLAA